MRSRCLGVRSRIGMPTFLMMERACSIFSSRGFAAIRLGVFIVPSDASLCETEQALLRSKASFTFSASAKASSGGTAFPICSNCSYSEPWNWNQSGKL